MKYCLHYKTLCFSPTIAVCKPKAWVELDSKYFYLYANLLEL